MMNTFAKHAPTNTTFDQCIKCTVCTVYCPVAKANPQYPGPKQSGPDGERLRLKIRNTTTTYSSYAPTVNAVKPLALQG